MDWLDTEEKDAAAFALIERMWRERLPWYRDLLEDVVFEYVHTEGMTSDARR